MLRRWLRWSLRGLMAAVTGAILFILYLTYGRPKMAAPSAVRAHATPERIARGEHLVETICDCMGCHAPRDFTRFGGPVIPETKGEGGVMPMAGLPGTIVAANITPDPETGIGAWTDGEIMRAIREGVDKNGRALFPLMPYTDYRYMSDEDVESIVAYLRTLRPIKKRQPETKINFPANLLIKLAPAPAGHVAAADRSDKHAYGKYLATIGGCLECHTPLQKGGRDTTKLLAGGRLFQFPGASVRSANITPENDTGIGVFTEEFFIHKIRSYAPYAEKESPKTGPESFTLMPWLNFWRMTDEELSAIYAYLRTVPPVYNAVPIHD
ncbi:MAG TPA: c-type cytochrome [Bryobacterales bacterium]|nr:c-type cytochrome [Bryobacterales bacterium]